MNILYKQSKLLCQEKNSKFKTKFKITKTGVENKTFIIETNLLRVNILFTDKYYLCLESLCSVEKPCIIVCKDMTRRHKERNRIICLQPLIKIRKQ